MYFIKSDDDPVENPVTEPKSETGVPADVDETPNPVSAIIAMASKSDVENDVVVPKLTDPNPVGNLEIIDRGEKRVYGRARSNLCFSSFYIFCEDFRKQLSYLYPDESETHWNNV